MKTILGAITAVLATSVLAFAFGAIAGKWAGYEDFIGLGQELGMVFGILATAVALFVTFAVGVFNAISWGAGTDNRRLAYALMLVLGIVGGAGAGKIYADGHEVFSLYLSLASMLLLMLSILMPLAEGLARSAIEWRYPPKPAWKRPMRPAMVRTDDRI